MHGVNKESRYSLGAYDGSLFPFAMMLCSLPKTLQAEHYYYPSLKLFDPIYGKFGIYLKNLHISYSRLY